MTTATATAARAAVEAMLAGDSAALVAACRADVLLDVVVPHWRYQVQGRDAVRAVLDENEFVPGRRVKVAHRTPTMDGELLEFEAWAPVDGEERLWRMLCHFRSDGTAVTEVVTYCSGIWDSATIARHAVEAPMVVVR